MSNFEMMDLREILKGFIVESPEILGGTPVFKGTRVPVKILFDYLRGGDSLEEFLDNYPTVERENAEQVLAAVSDYLMEKQDNDGIAA